MNRKLFAILPIAALMIAVGIYFAQPRPVEQEKPSKPRVSIITSVYDGDNFIEGFLKDITQQTIFSQCELIMINANSPGHEETVIKEYMAKYPNIVYEKLDRDPGLYAVWNRGIKMAHSDIVSNANLDDRSHPKGLEVQVEELEANPEVDLVYSGYLVTPLPNETFFINHSNGECNPPEFSIKNMRFCLPGPRPVWRKSMHDRFGFFSELFTASGDYEMWIRAVSLGAKYKKVNGTHVLYYNNPTGLSTDMSEKKVVQRSVENFLIHQKYDYLFNE